MQSYTTGLIRPCLLHGQVIVGFADNIILLITSLYSEGNCVLRDFPPTNHNQSKISICVADEYGGWVPTILPSSTYDAKIE